MSDPTIRPNNSQRILALDVFRGLTMAFMVLVGSPGSLATYRQLDHAPWSGWTLTDVVFPSFLWIAGVSIVLSTRGRQVRGVSNREIVRQTFRRCLILYLLGVALHAIPNFELHHMRLLGVLQRIAICIFATTLIQLRCRVRGQVALIVCMLTTHWLLLRFAPVPGFGAGDFSVEGNLSHYIDRIVLSSHNYAGTGSWDPEGILSTIPAIATALFGALCGKLLLTNTTLRKRCIQMATAGIALSSLGIFTNHWMPINKKLWTVSFCLLMAGIDFLLLPLLLWLVDGLHLRRGLTLPLAFGQNALAVYLILETTNTIMWSYPRSNPVHDRIFHSLFSSVHPPEFGSLLYALSMLSIISLIAWVMRRRGWILKL